MPAFAGTDRVRLRRRALALLAVAAVCLAPAPSRAATVIYAPTDALFPNPERGFYAHREVAAEGAPLDAADLAALRADGVTLVLRLYYLKSFRTTPLSATQLALVEADMAALRAAGSKAILRFAYSQSETEPDAPLATIMSHLDALEPALRANSDVIAAVQAGFIGSWGEWYYSSEGLDTTEARRAVLERILAALPAERAVQLRTPGYKRAIFARSGPLDPAEAFSGSGPARTGHHNDCFLASDDDYGTYDDPAAADKAWLALDARFVPVGGETCNPNPPRSLCPTALAELELLGWSYLNRDYHPGVLAGWASGGCFEEVERRLGYRLALVAGSYSDRARRGQALAAELTLANSGWAAPFNPRGVELELRPTAPGPTWAVRLPDDPRLWRPGSDLRLEHAIGLPSGLPPGSYELHLRLPDPAPRLTARAEYALRLANAGLWDPIDGSHDLGHALEVTTVAPWLEHVGPLWLAPRAPGPVGAARLFVTKGSASGELSASWLPETGAATSYNLYAGGLATLRASSAYDHAKARPGLSFPDSPLPADGCDVSSGAGNQARVAAAGAEPLYLLLVAVAADGTEGPYGRNGRGADRHDPSEDPRPASFFCP